MTNLVDFNKARHIHFIGIGGIGMSALARMMLHEGKIVSGSDRAASALTQKLAGEGIHIMRGHSAQNVPSDTDFVIYTIAVHDDNPELQAARKRNIPLFTYPQALGMVSRRYKTVAIAGTHGKTTTTAMVAAALKAGGLDPTVIVGSLFKESNTNFIPGKGQYFVVEACEYRRSFCNLYPKILIITNIEEDHLDYYKDLADIQKAFREVAEKVPKNGAIICNIKDPIVAPVVAGLSCQIVDYSVFINLQTNLRVPGRHNKLNAAAAAAVADFIGIPQHQAARALREFPGMWRRFEYKGNFRGALIYDDYAHHPTEIRAALQAAREQFSKKRIVVVFQPHLYSRTKQFFNEFVRSFDDASEVLFVPIYAAREKPDESAGSEVLAQAVQKTGTTSRFFPDFTSVVTYLNRHLKKEDILITMGAGDVNDISDRLVAKS